MDVIILFCLSFVLCVLSFCMFWGFAKELERFPRKLIVIDGESITEYQVEINRGDESVTLFLKSRS